MGMNVQRSARGALAGGLAAGIWAAQQPLDKRVFGTDYDDVELVGKFVTRGSSWPLIGTAIHVGNGMVFGAVYSHLKGFLPGPAPAKGLVAAMIENFGLWPLGGAVHRLHPARRELTPLSGNYRVLAQATWRHALFGVLLGLLEARLNADLEAEPPEIPVSSNGHGDIEAAAVATADAPTS
jgi:hypothetical protein